MSSRSMASLVVFAVVLSALSLIHVQSFSTRTLPRGKIFRVDNARVALSLRARPDRSFAHDQHFEVATGQDADRSRPNFPAFLQAVSKTLFPFALQLAVLCIATRLPAFAASTAATSGDSIAKGAGGAGAGFDIAGGASSQQWLKVAKKSVRVLKKLLLGTGSSSGRNRPLRAGDTKSDFSALINGISSVLGFGLTAVVAYLFHKRGEMVYENNMKRELMRANEYKENMYFEAVQKIVTKLNKPKLKGSVKASLLKQLKELDPDGRIQDYLKNGGDRPDLSDLMGNSKSSNKGKMLGGPGAAKRKKNPRSPSSSSAPSTSRNSSRSSDSYDDPSLYRDEEDNDENEQEGGTVGGAASDSANARTSSNSGDRGVDRDSRDSSSAGVGNSGMSGNTRNSGSSKSRSAAGGGAGSSISRDNRERESPEYEQVLEVLYESLEGVLPPTQRTKVVSSLKARLSNMSDSAKLSNVLKKIAQRIGDDQYWMDYAKNL